MNRKGFTLVELLAVIVILAILMVSAGAGVMATMNNSKINTFKNEALAAATAASNMYSEISYNGQSSVDYFVQDKDSNYSAMCVTLAGLVNNGYLDKDIGTYSGVILVEVPFDGSTPKYMIWMHNSHYGINGIEKSYINKLKFKKNNNGGESGVTSAKEISGGKVGIVTELKGIYKIVNYAQTSNESESNARIVGMDKSGTTTYSCPNGTLHGTECQVEENVPPTSTTYTCPSGSTQQDSNCITTETASKVCPSGYTESGSTCYKYDYTSKICPSGYSSYNETQCRKATNTTSPICPSGYTPSGSTCYNYSYAPKTCPSGYTESGSSCNKYCYAPKTCPSGYSSFSGSTTQCRKVSNTSPKICPSGYSSYNETQCRKISSTSASCPSGYTQSGSTCYKYSYASKTCPADYSSYSSTQCRKIVSSGSLSSIGVCPSDYSLSNGTCEKTVTTPATATITCPSGSTQQGSNCIKTSTVPASSYTNMTGLKNGSRDNTVTGFAIKNIYSYSSTTGTRAQSEGTVSDKDRGGTGAYYEQKIPCINASLE